MDKEKMDSLWKTLQSATQIKLLPYGEAVTIGGVFGEMRLAIEILQAEKRKLQAELDGRYITNKSKSNAGK
jgi:hypothetical protein